MDQEQLEPGTALPPSPESPAGPGGELSLLDVRGRNGCPETSPWEEALVQTPDLPFILNTFPNSELVKQVELFLFHRWGN